jgi:hypothetical protein
MERFEYNPPPPPEPDRFETVAAKLEHEKEERRKQEEAKLAAESKDLTGELEALTHDEVDENEKVA